MSDREHAQAEAGRQSEERFRLLVDSVQDYAIFMLDPRGHILTWNTGAQRIKGYQAQEIIGKHFSTFYLPEAQASGLPDRELEIADRTGSFADEGWRVRQDGSLFWANVLITAMRSPEGELVGFGKVTRDLTQRRQQEEALRRSEERFRLLVEGVGEYAIFMLDVNGHVATWNVGAERLKGYTTSEIIGQHFSIFYPPDARESGWPDHELLVAATEGNFSDEGWRLRKDGTRMWASVTITALRDDARRLVGFAKLTRDLTERKRTEAAEAASQQRDETLEVERSARLSAQRAARIKDEFLATLSHELRTPVSAILGWTEVLKRRGESMGIGDVRQAIAVIERNAKAQVELIDDMLDLSSIMAGKTRLDLQQIALGDVVAAAVESAEPAARAKDISLIAVLDPTPAIVNADAGRLQQVVWNLLTNAVKFTPKGGQVQVLLQRVNSCTELSVSDTGIGISSSFLPHVFDRFSQGDSSTTRSFGGLGLGLAISKQLVELHGGSISATSQGVGQGTTFVVTLPLSLLQPAAEGQHGERLHPTVASGDDTVALPDLSGALVYLVDDELDARSLLRRVFEDQGARVAMFDSASAALISLKGGSRPSLIVCDIGMPTMDGYQFIRTLRASETHADRIPALALTAFARAEDRKRSLVAGFQAHLAKPFDVAELVLLAAGLLAR